ncbi:MAG: hypothetical protein WCA46_05640, partial [Actinocatenispora sp.]
MFAPLTGLLAAHLPWKHVYLVLALVLVAVTIPAHWWGLRLPWPAPAPAAPDQPGGRWEQIPAVITRSRPFIVLVAVLAVTAFSTYALIIGQIPLLTGRGVSPATAAIAMGLGGLGQVAGRLGYQQLTAHTTARARTVLILTAAAATTGLLAAIPGPTLLLIAGVVLAGAARGVFTLLRATAISERWGARHYGRLNGILSAPSLLAAAIAPAAAAGLASTPR